MGKFNQNQFNAVCLIVSLFPFSRWHCEMLNWCHLPLFESVYVCVCERGKQVLLIKSLSFLIAIIRHVSWNFQTIELRAHPSPMYLCLSFFFRKIFSHSKGLSCKKKQLKRMVKCMIRSEKCQPQINSYWVRMFQTREKKIGKFSEWPLNVWALIKRTHAQTKAMLTHSIYEYITYISTGPTQFQENKNRP